ncbi:MAG: M20/M25/M40 family metallo-hydrolase [Planctomycetes bacterium]|nr:M20/M25/M40 family metallo-hydrolase [Planctomycetota bacterium]
MIPTRLAPVRAQRGRPAYPGAALVTLFSTATALLAGCTAPAPAPAPPAPPAPTSAPAAAPDARAAAVARIFDEALREERAWSLLAELVHEAPKRLAGSDGDARAVLWAERTLRAAGLERVRLQPVTVPHWERGDVERCELLGEGGGPLAIRALGGSVATPAGGLAAGVLRVTSFDELAARSAEARGRFVFFDRPLDRTRADPFEAYGRAVDQRSRGAIEAARHGAVGALVRSMTMARDDAPHTGAMRYDPAVPEVPAAALGVLSAERLAARLAEEPDARVRLELACRTFPDAQSWNVIGELLGSELPEEIVLVGAHLDSWDVGVGAHDDGAGCVHAIEAARLLLELGLRPRRTVRVVLFANEENGLRGGLAYRDGHLAELPRHVFALESDRGGFTPRGFQTDAGPELFARLVGAARLLEPYGAGMVRPGGGGADIGPLAAHGVPLAQFVPDAARYFDVHHADTDVLAAVHPRELALGAAAIAALVWCVADAP